MSRIEGATPEQLREWTRELQEKIDERAERRHRVYISSSWKNRDRVRALAETLRSAGHEVFDFTNPAHRQTPEIPPERFPEQFDPERHVYRAYLDAVPEWRAAVEENRRALERTDAVVLVLPCGMDAHADAFYALGRGAHLAVLGAPRAGERCPTHLWAGALLDADGDVLPWLLSLSKGRPASRSPRITGATSTSAQGVLSFINAVVHLRDVEAAQKRVDAAAALLLSSGQGVSIAYGLARELETERARLPEMRELDIARGRVTEEAEAVAEMMLSAVMPPSPSKFTA